MRLVAVILNSLVLGIAIPIGMMCILDHPERTSHWVVIPIALFALINLLGLCKPVLIDMSLKRETLEEQAKLDALKKDKESKQ